jgi:hypothetical protein
MSVEILKLDGAGWVDLEKRLATNQSRPSITSNLTKHLKALNAQAVLVQTGYLDRDFTEAYSAYYATLFKRHSKLCERLLFFSNDLQTLPSSDEPRSLAVALETIGRQHYLGQVVLRPIHEAPVAQVVLRPPPAPAGYEQHLLVRSEHRSHVLGAEFAMNATAMTQQDQRIGACAQATIWGALRHIHLRHRGPWLSMVGVSDAALRQVDATVSQMIPTGSEFLSLNGMVSALRSAGRKPLLYHSDNNGHPVAWTAVRPHDVINRYVDSGIPVIVGLRFPNTSIGHAVLATGQIFSQTPISPLPSKPTRAVFCEAFLVNDDQLGTNLQMPLRPNSVIAETHYDVAGNVGFLLIPLPEKVFLPAEKAEELAWDILNGYARVWQQFAQANSGHMGTSVALGNSFCGEINSNTVLARTYLTYGWKYQQRVLRNNHTAEFQRIARSTDLPRFVWVTEFGTLTSFGKPDRFKRRIYAHCVVDATAKNMGADSRLIFHAPGVALHHTHDLATPYGAYQLRLYAIKDDQEYYPKLRGNADFAGY